jgi:thioesterase domain-containing protein
LQQPHRRAKRRALVKIHGGGSRRPLFFSPSFGGESFFLKPLAQHLGDDQPIWSFQIPEKDGIRKPFRDIETMAAFFVDELTRSQIDGPYCLAGYSFGGAVALEMAQQLWARGQRVALLAILDWGFSAARPRTMARLLRSAWASLRNLPYWLIDDFLQTPGRQRLARLASEMRAAGRRLRDPWGDIPQCTLRAGDAADAEDALVHEYRVLQEAHVRAVEEYKPHPYPGRVTLFRSRCQGLLTSLHEHDFGLGRIAAGGVDVKTIPGNHLNMVQEPFVKILARELRRSLDDAQ